jgi:SIR2-like domain
MAVKTAAEVAQEFAQSAISLTPVLILGSGASAAHGIPGMWPLARHLANVLRPSDWIASEQLEWDSFLVRLQAKDDLETALQAIRPSDRQTQFIAAQTREFLMPADLKVLGELLADRRRLPLSRLFKHLFTSTHRTLHVVTPNYDRLAEYAADAAEFSTFTGFSQGYLQTRASHPDTRIAVRGEPTRTVCVWKVHGSLDWFQDAQKQIVGIRDSTAPPADFTPLMITPGIEKYRLTHGEPFRTIFGCSDKALEDARAYFCVGYGFNDEHVQTKLIERCERDSVPLVVITKELTATAKSFLAGGRCRRYLALEESTAGARAYSHAEPAGFDVPGPPIWQLDRFLDMTIGVST